MKKYTNLQEKIILLALCQSPTIKKYMNKKNKSILVGALVLITIFSYTNITPSYAKYKLDKTLKVDCFDYALSNTVERDISIDVDMGTFEISQDDHAFVEQKNDKVDISSTTTPPNTQKTTQLSSEEEHKGKKYTLPLNKYAYKNKQNMSDHETFNSFVSKYNCSPAAQEVIKEVQQTYDEYIMQSCNDFKNIIEHPENSKPKNGRTPNIKGAKDFISEYCI